MAVEIVIPMLGVTVERGTVVQWLKREGERVERGEILFVVETEKVTTEVESPAAGTLGPILVAEGEEVPILTVASHVLEPGESAPPAQADPAPKAPASPSEQSTPEQVSPEQVSPGQAPPEQAPPAQGVTEVVLPMLGVTVEKGVITKWLFKEGDTVNQGDLLFIVETEKVTTEVQAPASGVLAKILYNEGVEADLLTVVAYIAEPGVDPSQLGAAVAAPSGRRKVPPQTTPLLRRRRLLRAILRPALSGPCPRPAGWLGTRGLFWKTSPPPVPPAKSCTGTLRPPSRRSPRRPAWPRPKPRRPA